MNDPDTTAAINRVLDSTCRDFLAGGDHDSRGYIFEQLIEAAREGHDLEDAARKALATIKAKRAARASP